jgi:ArsR family metal-binding transcriptional regulator
VSFLPTLALVIWSARGALGLNLSFDAAPLMLLVFDGLVGLLIYMQRFAEIIPRATLDAFEHIRDSALIMNHRGLIMAMNASARQSMRGIMPGDELSQARPELAHRLQECFKEAAPPRDFEMRISDRVYRVRPRRTSSSVRERSHCVVLLNDVTDLRHAEEKLRVLHGDTLIRLSDRRTRN